MSRLAAFLAALSVTIFLTTKDSVGQTKTPDLTYNTYYESLVIPLSPEVLNELHLIDKQRDFLKKLGPVDSAEASGRGTPEQRKNRKDALNRLLSVQQRGRLKELTFQYQGALASFNLPETARSLGITAEQKQKLASVQYLLRTGSQNLNAYEKQLSSGAPSQGKFVIQLRLSCDCVAESVLFPAQMMKWREMQGKPFVPRPAAWD